MPREFTSSTSWNLLEKSEAGATICSHFTVMETEAEAIQDSRGSKRPHHTFGDTVGKNGSGGVNLSLRATHLAEEVLDGDGYKVDACMKAH